MGTDHLRPRPRAVLLDGLRRPRPGRIPGDGAWKDTTLSVHYSVWGDQVIAVTPFFLGANPAEVRKGSKEGLRILGRREDLAIELIGSS